MIPKSLGTMAVKPGVILPAHG
ncbi:hypothetical protein Tco_1580314, partial [Tanacetum coccineum]